MLMMVRVCDGGDDCWCGVVGGVEGGDDMRMDDSCWREVVVMVVGGRRRW
jgi:hypothetical protein